MTPARPDLELLAAEARAELVRGIGGEGVWEGEPEWRAAFAAVPRHLFVPYYQVGCERRWGEDPDARARERWVRGAYEDVPLATRIRDGELVSSSSQPSLMARMLIALDVRDGARVLEIGAGTGYNAALLAHRLGDGGLVTTVDLDPEITESARRHLTAAGYRPVVVTGDGARGVPERAPYDRILATCELPTVPRVWTAQCAPGARILAPVATGLLDLAVDGGHRAEGRFLPTAAYFVPLRGAGRATEPGEPGDEVPAGVREQDSYRFLLALVRGALTPREAHALWERAGRPRRERYGVTVTPDGTRAWLDAPEGPDTWPLP
ncbi:methyltransferase domain-containing protein [Streptomyces sp. J2-1]|uniref:methyltransferase domain-containing protein n=1 Tax=Streptomyces corallincola TaxID=2851888 RepID=UPI001C383C5B|nr:methyltransferase domain-containing protein [Streptomyces corallincola]MBV2357498.1 methyltransferase domain-containing protein [Streptomyces corallincola]